MMRIVSSDELKDAPYEYSLIRVQDYGKEHDPPYAIFVEAGQYANLFGKFKTRDDALREMRRIRRAYEAGAKFYIIGTGDHDGPMEVGK